MGFGDCNTNKRADGCEVDLNADENHCGGCGAACSANNITRSCDSGSCELGVCDYGYRDCNTDKRTDDRSNYLETQTVRIVEYQGLVPAGMLPETSDTRDKLKFEEDKPVEALVTIANNNVILRATENPLTRRDRGFVAFQWGTVPGQFWGRGVVEMGYWPQKVLDAEIRSRIDALGFSVMPMMGVNAAMVPRNSNFELRPGRNIFFNGPPSEAAQPFQFPPPDPQT